MRFEWTELTFQRILAGNTMVYIFPLSVLLVYLVLAAQYESWSLPLVVILIVPMTLLSAIAGRVAAEWRQQRVHADQSDCAGGAGLQKRNLNRGICKREAARGG